MGRRMAPALFIKQKRLQELELWKHLLSRF